MRLVVSSTLNEDSDLPQHGDVELVMQINVNLMITNIDVRTFEVVFCLICDSVATPEYYNYCFHFYHMYADADAIGH